MRWLALACIAVLSCAQPSQPEPAVLRQANALGMPDFIGTSGSLLGSSLSACRGPGFVAGAPGAGSAWLSGQVSLVAPVGNSLGRAVCCAGTTSAPTMWAGGSQGVSTAQFVGWVPLNSVSTFSLSRSDDSTLPILQGGGSSLRFLHPTLGSAVGLGVSDTTTGLGAAALWFPGTTPRFAVTHAGLSEVRIYDFVNNSATQSQTPIANPAVAGFGRALAVGDLFPSSPGLEFAIGAPASVFIYSATGTLLTRLTGSGDSSFGSALVVERDWAPGLDVLWVGEPGRDVIWQFVGTQGTAMTTPTTAAGAGFGASLAIDTSKTLAVGAPSYGSNEGAVYFFPLGMSVTLGTPMACIAGTNCVTPNCEVGDCMGGVFCLTGGNAPSACTLEEVCLGDGRCLQEDGGIHPSDAGSVPPTDAGVSPSVDGGSDAGPSDGGTPDGGVPTQDAGVPVVDAGTPDAGQVTPDGGDVAGEDGGNPGTGKDGGTDLSVAFSTTGCSVTGGEAWPLLLLGLALLIRR